MAAPVPPHPIAGNQTFDNFLKVIVDPKLHKERYDSLVKPAAKSHFIRVTAFRPRVYRKG